MGYLFGGSPVAANADIARSLLASLHSDFCEFKRLLEHSAMPSPEAFFFLSRCGISKLSHLARSMFPKWLEPFAEARDLLIDQTFLSIAGLPSEIPESAEIQIALPF